MKYSAIVAGIVAVVAAMPASAQERGVNRRSFTFLDDQVTVEVEADMAGTVQVIRGEPGLIEVSGRAPGGMTAFALGGREGNTLRLTAAGGERVDFIVVVPEDTYLRVRLPNSKAGELNSRRRKGSFAWPAIQLTGGARARIAPPAPGRITTAHTAPAAPRVLNVPRLNSTRTVTVRIEPGVFSVAGDQWMSVQNGSSTTLEIATGSQPENLEIGVPLDTRDFTLKLGGRTALVIRGIEVTSYCEPVTVQEFAGGARRFTFAPEMGRLTCR